MKQLILLCLLIFALPAFAEEIEVGNKLYLYLPGEAEFSEPFEVDKEGAITLPELGRFKVAGLQLDDVQSQLRAALSEMYVAMDDFYVEIHSREIGRASCRERVYAPV